MSPTPPQEQALLRLFDVPPPSLFSFRLGEGGTSGAAPPFLSESRARAMYQRVLEEGGGTFVEMQETPEGIRAWKVALVPDAPGEAPTFAGVACRVDAVPAPTPEWAGGAPYPGSADALGEMQGLFHGAFHLGPAALAISRLADGTFVDVNEPFLRLAGFSRDELIGRRAVELGLWRHPEARVAIVEGLGSDEAVRETELELRRRSGEVRTVLASLQRFDAASGAYLLTSALDITERKRAEDELRRAKEQAEEVARLRTSLLTNLTHEFRTPLTVILGFTSMLQKSVGVEYRRFVRLIERSGQRLLLLLDSVLDLAQLEAGTLEVTRESFDLLDVVRGVARTLRPLAEEKGLAFTLAAPPGPIYATIDHAVLQRVLSNLIDNAIKFTEEGHITLAVDADEEHLFLRIRDTGIGVDEAFLPYLFDEFSQESTGLERTHQGSGLGLAVSRRLVERIGGTIGVESAKEEGSVFTITLPRVPASA